MTLLTQSPWRFPSTGIHRPQLWRFRQGSMSMSRNHVVTIPGRENFSQLLQISMDSSCRWVTSAAHTEMLLMRCTLSVTALSDDPTMPDAGMPQADHQLAMARMDRFLPILIINCGRAWFSVCPFMTYLVIII